jgi:hypothetical protein
MRFAVLCFLLAGCFDYRGLSAGLGDASDVVSSDMVSTDADQTGDASDGVADMVFIFTNDLTLIQSDLGGTDLSPNCECSPGTARTRLCSICSAATDACGTDCKWALGSCAQQGACSPGDTNMSSCQSGYAWECSSMCMWVEKCTIQ